jgi:Mrp family chromosome partitioning ATPase
MSEKSENCNHDCSSCGQGDCAERSNPESFRIEPNPQSKIRKIIGVVSGKGGVGKSFVTSMMASEMQRRGHRTAVLDGDITGPSMGKAFGINEKATGEGSVIFPAVTKNGIQVISANMLLDRDDTPIIWRGPLIAGVLKQFYQDVLWKDVDYMFIDMPPGTGDVPLTIFQSIPLDGIIIVTSPQELVSMVVSKAINMANMMNVKILGIVENMSYVECPQCGNRMYVFGKSHLGEVATQFKLPVLARVPLDPRISEASDNGTIEDLEVPAIKEAADAIEKI